MEIRIKTAIKVSTEMFGSKNILISSSSGHWMYCGRTIVDDHRSHLRVSILEYVARVEEKASIKKGNASKHSALQGKTAKP
jgi:hypothetical protein